LQLGPHLWGCIFPARDEILYVFEKDERAAANIEARGPFTTGAEPVAGSFSQRSTDDDFGGLLVWNSERIGGW